MALVNCPNCGKPVSDSAEACPHCGFEFKAERIKKEVEREYGRLPVEKQKQLRDEYDRIYPTYKKSAVKRKKLSVFVLVGFLITFVLMVIIALLGLHEGLEIYLILTTVVAVIIFLPTLFISVFLVLYTRLPSGMKKRLSDLKKFQSWLLKEKQLTYHVVLTDREKQIFESIEL